LAVAAGIGAPLILTAASHASYVGTSHAVVPNEYGLYVVRVYAEFDNPGGDWMLSVAGTPVTPLLITVNPPGAFYNHPYGSDLAPSTVNVSVFPSLAFDSFFTIGLRTVAVGQTDHTTLVNLPELAGTSINTDNAAWGLIPPTADQGNPFDPVNCYPGDGRVLIGQFSSEDSQLIGGRFLMLCLSDGEPIYPEGSFNYTPTPCPWDCGDDDGAVTPIDFLALIAQWGEPDTPCDIDGNGVGISDLLDMLGNWGPCP
jgi:hypothetical protein